MDAILRDAAVVSPTACAFCGTFGTKVVDTGIDLLGHGRINICTRLTDDGQVGCAEIVGRLGGNLVDRAALTAANDEVADKARTVSALLVRIGELEQEVADTAKTAERINAAADKLERGVDEVYKRLAVKAKPKTR